MRMTVLTAIPSMVDAVIPDRKTINFEAVRMVFGLILGGAVAAVLFILLFLGSVQFGEMIGFDQFSVLFPFTAEFPVLVATLCWWEKSHKGKSTVYAVICFVFFLLLTVEYQIGNVVLGIITDPAAAAIAHIAVMTQAALALALVTHLLISTYAPGHKGTPAERRLEVMHKAQTPSTIFASAASRKPMKDGIINLDRAIAVEALSRFKEDGKTWKDVVAETGKPMNFVRAAAREYSTHREEIDAMISADLEGTN